MRSMKGGEKPTNKFFQQNKQANNENICQYIQRQKLKSRKTEFDNTNTNKPHVYA